MQNSPEESFELIHEIDASPELVFQFFTDAELLERWHGVHAETEPRPGGRFMLNITGQTVTRGIFLELDPGRHLVFRAGSASAADYGRGNVHPAGARGCGCVISALQPRSPATTISAVGATICRGSPWPPAAPTRVWTHGARLPPRLGQSRCRRSEERRVGKEC